MAPTRRKFTLEFRTEAAHRVIDSGRSVVEVAKKIAVPDNSLRTRLSARFRPHSLPRQVGPI